MSKEVIQPALPSTWSREKLIREGDYFFDSGITPTSNGKYTINSVNASIATVFYTKALLMDPPKSNLPLPANEYLQDDDSIC